MTLTELRRMVYCWQERLRLMDWDVTVRFAKRGEFDDLWGVIFPENHTKDAEMVIGNPKHYVSVAGEAPRDVEVVVVHELLHLHFAPFDTKEDSPQEDVEEQTIHALSELLVALSRQDEKLLTKRKLSKRASFAPANSKKAIDMGKPVQYIGTRAENAAEGSGDVS